MFIACCFQAELLHFDTQIRALTEDLTEALAGAHHEARLSSTRALTTAHAKLRFAQCEIAAAPCEDVLDELLGVADALKAELSTARQQGLHTSLNILVVPY